MTEHTPLIATVVAGLVGAYVLGAVAQRLKISPLVGYLLAGILVGPFTPGYVADQRIATELAEIGIILLMVGVGLHFSLRDLLSVRAIAIPGALAQIVFATLLGLAMGHWLGWSAAGGLVFGLSLSVASTVVLLRSLQERHLLRTDRGRIAVGWLVVEDLAMVLALVLLPPVAGLIGQEAAVGSPTADWILPLGVTIAKVVGFIAFMLVVGRRVIPWVLHYVAHTGSRELFRLAVFSIAIGVAFGAALLFDVSFALGAFFAGMILAESELSQRAAEETLPLRDAFAVLFFVSVGMLFNPMVLIAQPLPLLATLAIILVGKSVAALVIVRLFRHGAETGLTIAASLAQIGEFSFILAGLGVTLGVLPAEGRDLVLAGAIISIMLNPLLFGLAASISRPRRKAPEVELPAPANDLYPTYLTNHVVLVGFGRVGEVVADGLEAGDWPFLVIEYAEEACRRAQEKGIEVIVGNGADGRLLDAAKVTEATRLLVAIPDGYEAGQVVEQARRLNPGLDIVARAHSDEEVGHLLRHGADETIMGEREIARAMLAHVRRRTLEDAADDSAKDADSRPILRDVEYAILGGIKRFEIGPGEPVSVERLFGHAASLGGYSSAQLTQAVRELKSKCCLADAPFGKLTPTRRGFVAAAEAPSLP